MDAGGVGKTALVTGPSALVSGATGFLGGHLAALLHARGWKVRALARRTSDVSRLEALGVEIVQGDVGDLASLARAAAGQRVVFHTAGKVTDWGRPEEFFRANADGTAAVVAACQQAGVERLVHVSSLTVLGLHRTGAPVDEASPYDRAAPDPYTRSKIAGEERVRAAHGERGLATTVVRPGVIWGPGDVTIVPRIVALLRRGLMVLVDGGRNHVALSHVENLAEALRLAAEAPAAAGQVYHVTDGEALDARTVIEALAEAAGAPPPRASLPFWAVHGAAAALEGWARLTGREAPPALTRYGVRLVACDCRTSLEKARRELGYRPAVSFRQGIEGLALG